MHESSLAFHYCPALGCGKTLSLGPLGEEHWCEDCCREWLEAEILTASAWRKMSLAERSAEIAKHGDGVKALYSLSQRQFEIAKDLISARDARRHYTVGDVSPDKAALLSLARGISDVGALREFIDNSMDCAQRKGTRAVVAVSIRFDSDDGSVTIRDNAGGMDLNDLMRCLRLGSIRKDDAKDVIGRFGVGAKEAIYHFGREVLIRSREANAADGLGVEVPEAWLSEVQWNVDIEYIDGIEPGSTEIRIGALNKFGFELAEIRRELWKTYRRRVEEGRLAVYINDEELTGAPDAIMLYPPELYPRSYSFRLLDVTVDLDIAMLDDAPTESGIFFYAMGRQYAHWQWGDPRVRMLLEKSPQHRLNSKFRIDIDFGGKIDDIPINANKDEVAPNRIFGPLAKIVSKLALPYLSSINWLSKAGNLSFVTDRFSGAENAYIGAKIGGPRVELGKITEASPLSKPFRADYDDFKRIVEGMMPEEPREANVPPLLGPPVGLPREQDRPEPSLVQKAPVVIPQDLATIDKPQQEAASEPVSGPTSKSFVTVEFVADTETSAKIKQRIMDAGREFSVSLRIVD